MKNTSQILNLLLASALVILAIKFTLVEDANGNVATPESSRESVIGNIMTRSSVRAYTSEKVSSEDVEIMLKAAMAAPTAGNRQPWQFVVIDDTTILNRIPGIVRGARMVNTAPLAIIACGDMEVNNSLFWVQDVSAATENLLLTAHALGLGAVWCGVFPDSNNRIEDMQQMLSLPESIVPLNVIVIGHPTDAEPVIKDKWVPEKVSYNKFGKRK